MRRPREVIVQHDKNVWRLIETLLVASTLTSMAETIICFHSPDNQEPFHSRQNMDLSIQVIAAIFILSALDLAAWRSRRLLPEPQIGYGSAITNIQQQPKS